MYVNRREWREREGRGETDRHTNRQTNRQTDKQTDRRTDRQTRTETETTTAKPDLLKLRVCPQHSHRQTD